MLEILGEYSKRPRMTFLEVPLYLEDDRDVDTKEYYGDFNLLERFQDGIK